MGGVTPARLSTAPLSITVLGPERPAPALPAVLAGLGVSGPVALVTAGWRFDEARDEPLREALARPVENLALYQRFRLLERDMQALAAAYSAKQRALQVVKERYRIAITHAHRACRALLPADPTAASDPWLDGALRHLREVDAEFLREADVLHARFGDVCRPAEEARVRRQLAQIDDQLSRCAVVLIAGGHVGVLRNRLAFYDLRPRLAGKHVIAWSGGAMCLTERVLLFHDHTSFGDGTAELLDRGLGLLSDVVYLPHARQRLDLENVANVAVLARRLAPAAAIGLDNGAVLRGGRSCASRAGSAYRLGADGAVSPLPEAAECSP